MKTKRTPIRKSITADQFRNFIFAGRSIFTLENTTTNTYITFKIRQIKKKGKLVPNNFGISCKGVGSLMAGFIFLGFLHLERKSFKRWGEHKDNPSFIGYKTLFWLFRNLENLENFPNLELYHEGICCKCGRTLTVPESIDTGIGPKCLSNLLVNSAGTMRSEGVWDDLLTYDNNVRKALQKDPTLWSRLHIPEHIKLENPQTGHRLLGRLGIF